MRNEYESVNNEHSDETKSETEIEKINFQQALTIVGGAHFYQKRAYYIFGFQWFLVSWILFAPVFLFRDPNIDCQDNPNCLQFCSENTLNKQCKQFICNNENNRQFVHSPFITTAFDTLLTCEDNLASLIQSMVYFGSFIGLMTFPVIADNYGRKITLQITWAVCTIGVLILGLAQNLFFVGLGLFLSGFGANPAITIHFSFINEHSQGEFREHQNVGVQIFFVFGEISIILLAMFVQNWRTLTLVWIFLFVALMNYGQQFIFESPLFLYQKDKKKCVEVLNQIAILNKRQQITLNQLEDNIITPNNERMYTIIDLFKYKSLRVILISGFQLFFGIQIIYYGISYASSQMGVEFFLNLLIIASCELISFILVTQYINQIKRKQLIIIGSILIFIFSLPFLIKSDTYSFKIIQGILAGIMRFTVCAVQAVAFVYFAELFPSIVRSISLGMINSGGQIGSFSQSFLINWSNSHDLHPMAVFGFIALIVQLLIFPLKETLNQSLPDQIEEELNCQQKYQLKEEQIKQEQL